MAIRPAKTLLDMYKVQNCMLAASITLSVGDAVIINTAVPQTVTTNGTNTTAASKQEQAIAFSQLANKLHPVIVGTIQEHLRTNGLIYKQIRNQTNQ